MSISAYAAAYRPSNFQASPCAAIDVDLVSPFARGRYRCIHFFSSLRWAHANVFISLHRAEPDTLPLSMVPYNRRHPYSTPVKRMLSTLTKSYARNSRRRPSPMRILSTRAPSVVRYTFRPRHPPRWNASLACFWQRTQQRRRVGDERGLWTPFSPKCFPFHPSPLSLITTAAGDGRERKREASGGDEGEGER